MTERRGPRAAWMVSIGVILVLALAAALLAPRLVGGGEGAAAEAPRSASAKASSSTVAPASASRSAGPAGTPSATPSTTASPAKPAGTIHLLGFGDSVMSGAGCDCDDFLAQTAEQLQSRTGQKVSTTNNGLNGQTAAGVLDDLRTDKSYAAEIAQADVIVLILGANDLGPALDSWDGDGCNAGCYKPQITTMQKNLAGVLAIIDTEKRPGTLVLVMDYWNVFEDGDVGQADYGGDYLQWSDSVTRQANTAICQEAEAAKATCVDTYAPFKGDGSDDPTQLLAEDGDHPNDAGTKLLADVVRAAVLKAWGTS